MKKMKVVFADIDGVFRPMKHQIKTFDADAVSHLQRVCQETGAKVVVSSDMRSYRNLAWFQAMFMKAGFAGEVIGTTPVWREPPEKTGSGIGINFTKIESIRRWLEDHMDVDDWCVIDDDTSIVSVFGIRGVGVSSMAGFTRDDADRVVSVLNKRKR